jgi:zinc protease
MIEFVEQTLTNGLRVIVNRDQSSELVAVNLIYKVGASDEHPDKTGFAHLFEHLMFGGSKNIPNFDLPLQLAGGENNAFTNNDFTNYYITLPHQNLETAFWLESDRMMQLDFSQQSLDVQKKVVLEEFNQRYFNQPYGDLWLLLRPLVFTKHPYKWAAIGKEMSHIQDASLKDVESFFYNFYRPNNAYLSISGNVDPDKAFRMAQKWFSDIPAGIVERNLKPDEPKQLAPRELEVFRNVPTDSIYMVFHMDKRDSSDFYCADLLTDILSSGPSSRLTKRFIRDEQVFLETNAFITGDLDPGMFIITAKPRNGVSLDVARQKLHEEIEKILSKPIGQEEMQKVKNKNEANFIYGQTNILNKAMNLGLYSMLGKTELINEELDKYNSVSQKDIISFAERHLDNSQCSTLYYKAI